MAFWEFLIQKDGDRSWLPIEPPGAEILEGRYRIVARASRVNTLTEIRITHIATQEDPPKRRVQKRQGQTNPEGLLVVMPYTQLQPGVWELRCNSDLMADMMGDSWQYSVQLEVLPVGSDLDDDWDDGEEDASTSPPSKTEVAPVRLRLVKASNNRKPAAVPTPEPPPKQEVAATVEPALPQEDSIAAIATDLAAAADSAAAAQPSADAAAVLQELATARGTAPSGQGQLEPVASEPMQTGTEWMTPTPVEASAPTALHPTETVDLPAGEHPLGQPVEQPVSPSSPDALTAISSFAVAEAASQQVVDEVFQALDLDSEEVTQPVNRGRATPPNPLANAAPDPIRPLQLVLSQDAYVARRGQSLNVAGRVVGMQGDDLPASVLHLCLRDPQSGQVLLEEWQELAGGRLPTPFEIILRLPAAQTTRLFVGELSLQADQSPHLLAHLAFTVTTDVDELLEAIANTFSEPQAMTEIVDQPAEIDLSFLNFLSAPKPVLVFTPSSGQVLPPQIHAPSAPTTKPRSLDLPTFKPLQESSWPSMTPAAGPPTPTVEATPQALGSAPPEVCPSRPTSQIAAEAVVQPEAHQPAPASPEMTTISTGPEAIAPALPPEPAPAVRESEDILAVRLTQQEASPVLPPPRPASPSLPELADEPLDWDVARLEMEAPPVPSQPLAAPPSPEDLAFRSLNLKHRFWQRLNSLAADRELPTLLKEEMTTLGLDMQTAASQEVVVEDEPPPPRWSAGKYQPSQHQSSGYQSSLQSLRAEPVTIPADEPIPMPQLQVAQPELIAGDRIQIGVKLAQTTSPLYVKLWMYDPQNQAVVEGPRWLMDFSPTGLGDLESWTQLEVPHGCLEVQIEAIAIEIATQRESHKTSLPRSVVPPDLPAVSFDELEGLG